MKFNLNNEIPSIKEQILLALLPAFSAKDIYRMTGIEEGNIGYYRRKNKASTLNQNKKQRQAEGQQNIRDQLNHNQEYALSVVEDLLHENGIPYE